MARIFEKKSRATRQARAGFDKSDAQLISLRFRVERKSDRVFKFYFVFFFFYSESESVIPCKKIQKSVLL